MLLKSYVYIQNEHMYIYMLHTCDFIVIYGVQWLKTSFILVVQGFALTSLDGATWFDSAHSSYCVKHTKLLWQKENYR